MLYGKQNHIIGLKGELHPNVNLRTLIIQTPAVIAAQIHQLRKFDTHPETGA